MRSPAISLDQLASLPAVYRAVIPTAYEDRNGHMNMRWYLTIYDEAGEAMYPMLGLTADYFAASGAGGFDLEHHLWYSSEVRIGDTVVIRARILARSLKLFHYMMFMVNETRGMLSSLFECVHVHADLRARRTAPFPAQVAAQIDALVAEHRALEGFQSRRIVLCQGMTQLIDKGCPLFNEPYSSRHNKRSSLSRELSGRSGFQF